MIEFIKENNYNIETDVNAIADKLLEQNQYKSFS